MYLRVKYNSSEKRWENYVPINKVTENRTLNVEIYV